MDNELIPQPSWWKRNWKWVVPLGGCLTAIVLVIILISSIYFGVNDLMEGSEPYEYAIELINKDEELIGLLGSPIEKTGMGQNNMNWVNGTKTAKMAIPIAGPKGSGTLFINASGKGDAWDYHEIRVEVAEKELDFLENDHIENSSNP